MHSRKNENEQLKNLLSEYFKMRSYFPCQRGIRDDQSSTYRENNFVHQKFNKPKPKTFEFATYCSMTSLHGFRHFVENNFNNIGKLFWAICLVAIYVLCGFLVYIIIHSYFEMQPIISLDSSVSWIGKIPFPAITVCSGNSIRPSVYNYSDANSDQSIRNVMQSICEKIPTTKKLKFSEEFLEGSLVSQVLKENIITLTQNLSFPCPEVIKSFHWMQIPEDDVCSVWVQETFTSYGLCYSFNMMPMGELLNGVDEWSQDGGYGWKNYQSGWHPDSGYSDDALNNHLPIRTLSNSEYYSAKMKLDLHTEDFNRECGHGMDVFYILIHSPAEWPDRSHPTLIASVNTLETLSVKPIVLTTSGDLISSDPDKRNCYFQNERKLKFFKIYTKKNCVLECRSGNILAKCGCVPFYHLRTKTTPVCGNAKIPCWIAASHSSSEACGCLPGCAELHFKLSPTKAKFNQSIQNSDNKSASFLSSVLLSVYYRHRNYIGFNRIMTSTFGQFTGNIGGIMGLCLGFSFLSLAEIIYFLTLRPLVNFCNTKKKMKKVDTERIFGKMPTSFTE